MLKKLLGYTQYVLPVYSDYIFIVYESGRFHHIIETDLKISLAKTKAYVIASRYKDAKVTFTRLHLVDDAETWKNI